MWENVGKMTDSFFSGSYSAKLDEKNRFVLPQELRYQLVEDGKLEFTIALSMGGCLAIYRKKDIKEIVDRFKKKQHIAKFQKFFTLFFSTLVEGTCDKVGRVTLSPVLKNFAGIDQEMMLAGALNKIELWPRDVYEKNLSQFEDVQTMMEEAFSLLGENDLEEAIDRVQQEVVRL